MTERHIFLAVLDLPDPEARSRYLDQVCGDQTRRARIESLLRSHETAGTFLEHPAVAPLELDGGATQDAGGGATPGNDADDADDALGFLQPPTRPDSLGRLGHYEALQVLGKGGFGIVFRAFDERLQRVVALKVLSPPTAAASPARRRFLREARSSAKVRHENVVQVYAVEERPLPYLVMEFIPGETLQQLLDRIGPLEAAEVAEIGRQIAEGLAAAHATGLIHRDVKPANILIEAGPNRRVKITDFGLARAADDASMTQSGVLAGTPLFMSPEQASGETLDHRADLFSLGSVLYTMATGRPPFRARSTLAVLKRVAEDTPRPIREIIPEVPQWLCDVISRLHAKRPDDRIGTAQEVADLLARGPEPAHRPANVVSPAEVAPAAAGEQLPACNAAAEPAHPSKAAPARRPRFRSRRAVAAAVLLVLLGGLGVTEATGVTNVRGTVIRLFSPEGTLIVEVDDPEVSVRIDGSEIVITGAGAKEIRLKPGRYTVEATRNGKVVRRDLVTVAKNGREVVRISQEAAPAIPQGADTKGPAAAWTVLKPIEMKSGGGATLTLQGDRSVLVSGDHPDGDVYALTFRELPPRVQSLRLEALPHASLPNGGPGRHPRRTFVLTTIRAELDQPEGQPLALKLSKAWGDYGEADSLPTHAIDAEDITGWAAEFGRPRYAVFELAAPVAVAKGMALRVTLEFKHDERQRQLGCFRLSASPDLDVQRKGIEKR